MKRRPYTCKYCGSTLAGGKCPKGCSQTKGVLNRMLNTYVLLIPGL